jgi:hypothetical protein
MTASSNFIFVPMKKATKRIILGLCGLTFIIYVIIKGIGAFQQNGKAFEQVLPSTYSLPNEDWNVVSPQHWNQVVVNEVLNSKVRNPIVLATFNSESSLIITKIDLKTDISLQALIHSEIIGTDASVGRTYATINPGYFSFQYAAEAVSPAADIYLTFAGDSVQNFFKSDSIVSYHLLCKNFSMRYTEDGPVDIFVKSNSTIFQTVRVPMDILFLKRKGSCFILFMTPNDKQMPILPKLLYNIVTQ